MFLLFLQALLLLVDELKVVVVLAVLAKAGKLHIKAQSGVFGLI